MAGDLRSSSHGQRVESIRVIAARLQHSVRTHLRRAWISDVIWTIGPLSTREIADLAKTYQGLTRAQVERLLTDMRQDGVLVAVDAGVNRAVWWSEPGQAPRPRAVAKRKDALWHKRAWSTQRAVAPERPTSPTTSWWITGRRDQFTQQARQRFRTS